MSWLAWYFGISTLTLFIVFLAYRLASPNWDDIFEKMRAVADASRMVWYRRLLFTIEVPALAAVLVTVGWPVALVLKVKDLIVPRTEAVKPMPREFAVTRGNLRARFSVAEIESAETVHDPLNAVPDLPFGHLHRAWLRLKTGLRPGEEIWSFSAVWTTPGDRQELREGYVVVADACIGPYLLTCRRSIDETKPTDNDMTHRVSDDG